MPCPIPAISTTRWYRHKKLAASSIDCMATKSRRSCGEKCGRSLSAGRVQSVAVRLIVERERQRMAFVSATYWDLLGLVCKASVGAIGSRPS